MFDYILYGASFCPFTRKVKFLLEERSIKYQYCNIKYWLKEPYLIKLNPSGEIPVLVNKSINEVICDSFIICNYIDDKEHKDSSYFDFLGNCLSEKYEVQRLHMWFDKKFYNEVTKYVIEEVFLNSALCKSSTNMEKINVANENLDSHIKYIEFLLTKRKWLACDAFTIADISAATQLSILDYLGYIDWGKYKKLKEWYITIKSKKGFRKIMYEKIAGFRPSKYYTELDF